MQKEQEKLKEEFKSLIAKSNNLLNSGQNKQRATAYLYVIFSLIALSFFGMFAIGPTITTISELNKQFEEETDALKQLQAKNASLKSLNAKYIDIQDDLYLVENAIPNNAGVTQLTRQLEELSIAHNLIVQKLDTGLMELYPAKNTNTSIYSYSISIGVSGDESDVNAFITDFINMGRIVGIEKLTTGKKQNDNFSASITARAYYYKE